MKNFTLYFVIASLMAVILVLIAFLQTPCTSMAISLSATVALVILLGVVWKLTYKIKN